MFITFCHECEANTPHHNGQCLQCKNTEWVMTKKQTHRGFDLIEFNDYYNVSCSIQKSSLADKEAIWIGCDNANPRVLTEAGWKSFPFPEGTLFSTRMHLTQDQVKELLPILQKFAETGEIS